MSNRARFVPLAAAVTVACAADAGVTLVFQPAAYWAGDYPAALEANPAAYPLLAFHPAAFVGGVVVWVILVGGSAVAWDRPWVRAAVWVIAVSHVTAAAAWLWLQAGAWRVAGLGWLVVGFRCANRAWDYATFAPGASAAADRHGDCT